MPINQEGDIDIENYMWVKITWILTRAERKELYDELDDNNVPVDDESWPTLRLLQSILNEEDPESGEFYGHYQRVGCTSKMQPH